MPKQSVKVITGTNRYKKNARILLLGSERIGQTAIREVLERAGHVVLAAEDLGTAVIMLSECPADLLITHPYIAELPGHEAIKYLRTKIPGMLALMVAGVMEDDRVQNEADLERFTILPAPFTAAQLVEEVRSVLKLARTSPNPSLKESKIGAEKPGDTVS